MNSFKRQVGFSLIELLVALGIGAVVLSGITTTYVAIISSAANTLTETQLVQQLSSVVSVMGGDIRRASYWGNRTNDELYTPTANPFNQVNNTALEVLAANVQVAANSATGGECILYAYDADEDGILDDADISGFRLNANTVEMRVAGDTGANPRHDICNDSDDTWMPLTDPNTITVTTLNFSLAASECLNTREPDGLDNDLANGVDDADEANCYVQAPTVASGDLTVETRQITISIAATSAGNATIAANLSQDIRARNDLIRTW